MTSTDLIYEQYTKLKQALLDEQVKKRTDEEFIKMRNDYLMQYAAIIVSIHNAERLEGKNKRLTALEAYINKLKSSLVNCATNDEFIKKQF